MKLVHISDLHFGNEDTNALAAAAGYIADERPDMVIATGDITAVGSSREMNAAFAWLRALGAPVLATPGNHDTPYLDILPRLFDPFGCFHRASDGVHTQAWVSDQVAMIPINTARGVQWRKNWALGIISQAQVNAAIKQLDAAPHSALKIIATHHPLAWPNNAPIAGDTRGGPKALEQLLAAGADLFLSGHLHLGDIAILDHGARKAACITAGTLSVRHRGEPGGFIAIRHAPGASCVEIERLYAVGTKAVSAGVTALHLSAPAPVIHGAEA